MQIKNARREDPELPSSPSFGVAGAGQRSQTADRKVRKTNAGVSPRLRTGTLHLEESANRQADHSPRWKREAEGADTLEIAGSERVGLAKIAGFVAFAKPPDALLGGAVRERLGHDVTL